MDRAEVVRLLREAYEAGGAQLSAILEDIRIHGQLHTFDFVECTDCGREFTPDHPGPGNGVLPPHRCHDCVTALRRARYQKEHQ